MSNIPFVPAATGYDIFGNVITQTDATGAVTTSTYIRGNGLIQVGIVRLSSYSVRHKVNGRLWAASAAERPKATFHR